MPVKQKDQHSVCSQQSASTGLTAGRAQRCREMKTNRDILLSDRFKTLLFESFPCKDMERGKSSEQQQFFEKSLVIKLLT